MDYQLLFNLTFGIASAAMGAILKTIWDAVRNLEDKVHDEFVRRDDFKEAIRDIRQDINVIFSKIEATVTLIYKKLEDK